MKNREKEIFDSMVGEDVVDTFHANVLQSVLEATNEVPITRIPNTVHGEGFHTIERQPVRFTVGIEFLEDDHGGAMYQLGKDLVTEHKVIPVTVSHVSEAWMKAIAKEDFDSYVPGSLESDPERIEVVVVTTRNVSGVSRVSVLDIERDANNVIHLVENKPLGNEGDSNLLKALFYGVASQVKEDAKNNPYFNDNSDILQ